MPQNHCQRLEDKPESVHVVYQILGFQTQRCRCDRKIHGVTKQFLLIPHHPANPMRFFTNLTPTGKVFVHQRMETGVVAGFLFLKVKNVIVFCFSKEKFVPLQQTYS